jgi:hypothetical protein
MITRPKTIVTGMLLVAVLSAFQLPAARAGHKGHGAELDQQQIVELQLFAALVRQRQQQNSSTGNPAVPPPPPPKPGPPPPPPPQGEG